MNRSAFTLIEVIIALAIIALLSSMVMPLVSTAQKRAKQTNTISLLRKVETSLELFHGEMDTYPYQLHPTADPFPAADNRLAWTLGKNLNASERSALDIDLAAVRAAYAQGGCQALVRADVDPRYGAGGSIEERNQNQDMGIGMANRMGVERASLAVIAGNTAITGLRSHLNQRVLTSPASQGFARDYLAQDLESKRIQGDAIIDLYGNPLVYVCPVIQGMRSFHAPECVLKDQWQSTPDRPVDVQFYGLQSQGRDLATDMASDLRNTAASAYRFRYELWSTGPDGRMDAQRDGSANRDNIAATDYWRELR
jgi:prepilin-type N-terminal cleavage/methylation domain-containing protein